MFLIVDVIPDQILSLSQLLILRMPTHAVAPHPSKFVIGLSPMSSKIALYWTERLPEELSTIGYSHCFAMEPSLTSIIEIDEAIVISQAQASELR